MDQHRTPTLADLVRKKITWMEEEIQHLGRQREEMEQAIRMIEAGKLPGKENKTFALYEEGFLQEVMRQVWASD